MSSSKEPPVDQGPIPFGNPTSQGNNSQQGFFGAGQSQQGYSVPTSNNGIVPPSSSDNSQYLNNRQQQNMTDNLHSNQTASQGTYASQGQQPSNGATTNQSSYYDNNQYQGTNMGLQHQKSIAQLSQQQQQQQQQQVQIPQHQQGATLTQAYNPPFYNQQYAESVVSDISYQQHYQNYDQNQQYQQQYYQTYDPSQQQQNNYSQSQQYNYSQQQYAYNQQQYDYSQQQQYDYSQQQQYGYTQQDQYNYNQPQQQQQQLQKEDTDQQQQQQYDSSQQAQPQQTQQQLDANNQQVYGTGSQQQYNDGDQQNKDVSQQQQQYGTAQQYDATQQQQQPDAAQQQQQPDIIQQQPDVIQQQQYDTTQQQQYDTTQQQQYDTTQQQQYDTTQQQQYDTTQQQQYDTTQQQQYDTTQQQQYDTTQQQQYDTTQQQQYDTTQQQQYDTTQQQQYDTTQQQQYDTTQQQQYDGNQQQQSYDTNQQYLNEASAAIVPENNNIAENAEVKGYDNYQYSAQNPQGYVEQNGYQNVEVQQYSSNTAQSENNQDVLTVNQHDSKAVDQQTEVLNQSPDQQIPQEQTPAIAQYDTNVPEVHQNHQPTGSLPDQTINDQQQNHPYGSSFFNPEVQGHLGVLPPSVAARINSPQPGSIVLVPCPDPNCEGENKPRAKFCSECGRPLASLSRASTPMAPFSPQTQSYAPSPYQSHQQSQAWYGNQYGYYDQSAQQQQLESVAPPDPLQRNKGYPLASFGFGGKLCLTFPNKTPSKVSPSGVQLKDVKELTLPNVNHLSDFIGSILMNASVDLDTKKQSAITYMNTRIDEFYSSLQSLQPYSNGYYHLENKMHLWQLVKILIEVDGFISDGANTDSALYTLLYPNQPEDPQSNKSNIEVLRDYLLQGDRENAIQYAIQQNLWAHAFIIAKFVDQEIWKSVVENFVNQTLTNSTDNEGNSFYQIVYQDCQSLRVLYSLISGNSTDSVSHFLPKHSNYPIEDALSKWRETLILLLVNRNEHTDDAINKLGNLLKENSWTDAADICYIISSVSNLRTNDESTDSNLLGSQEGDSTAPLDSLYLTELYEFGISLNQYYNTSILPFLQSYKLVHAWWLVDAGHAPEASYYVESIVRGIESYDRTSTYLHQELLESVKELVDRLSGSLDNSINLDSSLKVLESKINKVVETSGEILEQNEATVPSNAPIEESTDTNVIADVAEVPSYNQSSNYETEVPSYNQPISYEAEVPTTLSYGQPEADYEIKLNNEHHHEANTYESTNMEASISHDQYVPQNTNNQVAEEYSSQYYSETTTEVNESTAVPQDKEPNPPVEPQTTQYQPEESDIKGIEQSNFQNENNYSVETNQQDYNNYNPITYENQSATLYTNEYTTSTPYDNQSQTNYTATEEKNTLSYDTQPATFDAVTEEYTTTTYEADTTTTTVNETNQEYISGYDHHSTDYSATAATHSYNSPYDLQTSSVPLESNQEQVSSYEPASKENDLTSHSPSYEPPQPATESSNNNNNNTAAWDDYDDSLGLGNHSTKKVQENEVKDNVDSTSTKPSTADQQKGDNSEDDDDDRQEERKGWGFLAMFSRSPATVNDKDDKKAVKANLGEQSSFYYDEKEGRWVNKNGDSPAAPAKPPPPPKASTLKSASASASPAPPPPSTLSSIDSTNKLANSSPTSPPLPSSKSPMLPKATTTPTTTPLDTNSSLQDLMNTPPPSGATRRGAAGKKKPMRSRYVDVFNNPPPS